MYNCSSMSSVFGQVASSPLESIERSDSTLCATFSCSEERRAVPRPATPVCRAATPRLGRPGARPGRDDEIQPRNHTRTWPVDRLADACDQVLMTLQVVYGFTETDTIGVYVDPFA